MMLLRFCAPLAAVLLNRCGHEDVGQSASHDPDTRGASFFAEASRVADYVIQEHASATQAALESMLWQPERWPELYDRVYEGALMDDVNVAGSFLRVATRSYIDSVHTQYFGQYIDCSAHLDALLAVLPAFDPTLRSELLSLFLASDYCSDSLQVALDECSADLADAVAAIGERTDQVARPCIALPVDAQITITRRALDAHSLSPAEIGAIPLISNGYTGVRSELLAAASGIDIIATRRRSGQRSALARRSVILTMRYGSIDLLEEVVRAALEVFPVVEVVPEDFAFAVRMRHGSAATWELAHRCSSLGSPASFAAHALFWRPPLTQETPSYIDLKNALESRVVSDAFELMTLLSHEDAHRFVSECARELASARLATARSPDQWARGTLPIPFFLQGSLSSATCGNLCASLGLLR